MASIEVTIRDLRLLEVLRVMCLHEPPHKHAAHLAEKLDGLCARVRRVVEDN